MRTAEPSGSVSTHLAIALALLLATAGRAAAQSPAKPDSGASAATNAELARRIDLLAREIEDSKLGEVAGAPESHHGLGPAASKVYAAGRGVSIGGYGEMAYEGFATKRQDETPSGALPRLDFVRQIVYVGYKYSDRMLFNSEVEFEHATTEKGGSVSVEFAYVDFLLRPAFNLRGGMLLVPMGFVNELHEPPVLLGVHRPLTETQIIPSTWGANGAGLFGETSRGLSYRAFVIESLRSVRSDESHLEGFDGSGLREGRQSGSESLFENIAAVARLQYERAGALAGASVFSGGTSQGVQTPTGRHFDARTTVFEGHAQLRRYGVRLRALVSGARVEDADEIDTANALAGDASVGSSLLGWYAEADYDLLSHLAPTSRLGLRPYARYEALDTQREVPTGYARNPANDQNLWTAGLAFYPHAQVVLKADFERHSNSAKTGTNQWNVALGYLF